MPAAKLTASLLLACALFRPGQARAETVNCTAITSVPAVISLPGAYCLTTSLTTNITIGNAIDIQASNVVIDMNGFRLGGLGAGLTTEAVGIHASDRQNITIRNGTIRGFYKAVALASTGLSQGHVIEQLRVDQSRYIGIAVEGKGSIVRNNQILNTTAFYAAVGISASGDGVRVLDNDISGVIAKDGGYGVALRGHGLAINNRIADADVGVILDTGKYRDNLTVSVMEPYIGGMDAGNNN